MSVVAVTRTVAAVMAAVCMNVTPARTGTTFNQVPISVYRPAQLVTPQITGQIDVMAPQDMSCALTLTAHLRLIQRVEVQQVSLLVRQLVLGIAFCLHRPLIQFQHTIVGFGLMATALWISVT